MQDERRSGSGFLLGISEILFPSVCPGCGTRLHPKSLSERPSLCSGCEQEIRVMEPPFCPFCGLSQPQAVGFDHQPQLIPCRHCLRDSYTRYYNRVHVAVQYNGIIQELIQSYKFKQQWWLVSSLVGPLARHADRHMNLAEYDTMCSVPLHRVRERERGFNQARLLLQELTTICNCAQKHTELLQRVLPTRKQSSLDDHDRRRNVRGAFALLEPQTRLKNKPILLMDDVMGTGSTVNECARVLKRAGAERVDVLVLARSPRQQ